MAMADEPVTTANFQVHYDPKRRRDAIRDSLLRTRKDLSRDEIEALADEEAKIDRELLRLEGYFAQAKLFGITIPDE